MRLIPIRVAAVVVLLLLGLAAGSSGAGADVVVVPGYLDFGGFVSGNAPDCSPGYLDYLNSPMVSNVVTPDDGGYWQAAADGGVFTCGDARFYGSVATDHLAAPIVGMVSTHDGKGYWLVASDGGVFNFGDAGFYGSEGGQHLNAPIVGIAASPYGGGYWLVASDGGVFSFGDAAFYGSAATYHLAAPVVGIASTPNGHGYWLAAADGGVFCFGNAPFEGSEVFGIPEPLPEPFGGIAATHHGDGYLLYPAPHPVDPSMAGRNGYDLARQSYLGNGYFSAADHVVFLDQAASYLLLGESLDPGPHIGYATAIAELENPVLGLNMATPTQAAQDAQLTAELDAFFDTPGLQDSNRNNPRGLATRTQQRASSTRSGTAGFLLPRNQ